MRTSHDSVVNEARADGNDSGRTKGHEEKIMVGLTFRDVLGTMSQSYTHCFRLLSSIVIILMGEVWEESASELVELQGGRRDSC